MICKSKILKIEVNNDVFDPLEIPKIEDSIEIALNKIYNLQQIKNKAVFIKPNWNFIPTSPNVFALTDPRVIIAVCNILYKYKPRKIFIGEKPGQGRRSVGSYDFIKSKMGLPQFVEFLELDSIKRIKAKTSGLTSKYLELPKEYLEADVIINIPKMKTHTLTDVSLGMKNLFGLLTDEEKMKHHNENINLKLVDIISVRMPEITIIDCLYAMESFGPLYGTVKKFDRLIMSNNVVCADAIGAYLMGFEPDQIESTKLAVQHNFGKIKIDRHSLDNIREQFKKPDLFYNPFRNLKIIYGEKVSRGSLNAIIHSILRLKNENMNPKGIIYVGEFKNIEPEKSLVLFGDQAIKSLSCRTSFTIKGNPPSAWSLYDFFNK